MSYPDFIAGGFADLIGNLPDQLCDWCGAPISAAWRRDGDAWFCDDFCWSDWNAETFADDKASAAADRIDDEYR